VCSTTFSTCIKSWMARYAGDAASCSKYVPDSICKADIFKILLHRTHVLSCHVVFACSHNKCLSKVFIIPIINSYVFASRISVGYL